MARLRREEIAPREFRWIVDGHNVIFAIEELEDLQLSRRRAEARRNLEEYLQRFGRAIGRQIWIVYDGNELDRNPDARDHPFLQTIYSNPPEEADDRIRLLSRQSLGRGERPVVVSADRRTLLDDLPEGARGLSVDRFFRQVFRSVLRSPEKWHPGGMDDIEEYFLRDLASSDQGEATGGRPETEDPSDR